MSKANVFVLIVLGFTVAVGQWVEKTILLPDSLGGAIDPTCVVYDSVNNVVYVGSSDAVHVVDAVNWQIAARIPVDMPVNALCFAPGYNKLYCLHQYTDWLTVIDCLSHQVMGMVSPGRKLVNFCYSPAFGKLYCASYSERIVSVVSVVNDSLIKTVPVDSYPEIVQHNPVDNQVYVGCPNTLTVIEEATDSVLAVIPTGISGPVAICFNPANTKAYLAGGNGVAVIDLKTNLLLDTLTVSSDAQDICYSPALDRIFCACDRSYYIRIYIIDAVADSVLGWVRAGIRKPPLGIESGEKGGKLYLFARHGNSDLSEVTVYNAATMEQDTVITVGNQVRDMLYVPSLSRLLCVATRSRVLAVLDSRVDTIVTRVWLGSGSLAIYSPSVHKLYVGGGDRVGGHILVIDPVMHRVVNRIVAFPNAFFFNDSNNKLYVATIHPDNGIKVYDGYTDSLRKFISLPAGVGKFLYHPRRYKLYCHAGGADVTVIDANSDTFLTWIEGPGTLGHYALVPDYDKLYLFLGDLGATYFAVVDCSLDVITSCTTMDIGAVASCYVPDPPRLFFTTNGLWVLDVKLDSVVKRINRGVLGSYGGPLYYNHPRRKLYWIAPANFVGERDSIFVIDVNTDSVVATDWLGEGGGEMCLDHTGNYLYILDFEDGRLWVFDCRGDSTLGSVFIGNNLAGLLPNYEHHCLYVPSYDSRLFVIRDTITLGCAETQPVSVPSYGPTIVRNLNILAGSLKMAELFDVTGRRIAMVQHGRLDTQITRPGIYFLRTGNRTTKVIIMR